MCVSSFTCGAWLSPQYIGTLAKTGCSCQPICERKNRSDADGAVRPLRCFFACGCHQQPLRPCRCLAASNNQLTRRTTHTSREVAFSCTVLCVVFRMWMPSANLFTVLTMSRGLERSPHDINDAHITEDGTVATVASSGREWRMQTDDS